MLHRKYNIPWSIISKENTETTPYWTAPYPNPADLNFNYRKLLDSVKDKSISINPDPNKTIAIIGMGIAGLTTARELMRCGYKVLLFEVSGQYGGRHDTHIIKSSKGKQYSVFEGGAMRMPPFLNGTSKDPKLGSSILSYYMTEFNIATEPFPNPGSAYADTGIFYNNGYESSLKTPEMLIWKKQDKLPPSKALLDVYNKWNNFANNLAEKVAKKYYPTSLWDAKWKHIVSYYWDKTFRDVVLMPIATKEEFDKGQYGGAGMSEEEATLFYIIGAGDGSWGAFFNLSFLYAYRTFIHGFSSNLQLIQGAFQKDKFIPGPEYNNKNLVDNEGHKIPAPQYLGVKTFDDYLMFEKVAIKGDKSNMQSLYTNSKTPNGYISINQPVEQVIKNPDGSLTLKTPIKTFTNLSGVVITTPTWNINSKVKYGIDILGFNRKTEWPDELQTYLNRAHWEPCCKIFVTLKEPYWENPKCKIPQLIATDTFLQDIYGIKVNQGKNQVGALLLSYTWWRDANKLVSILDQDLVNLAIKELDRILMQSKNIQQKISDYIDLSQKPYVIHWEKKPAFKGAARLYDESTWKDTQLPMEYNQEYSKNSGIYFAGEAFGVDAGWTEPAFRTAIDTVLYISKNLKAKFQVPNFNIDKDYPKYDTKFNPHQTN